MDLIKSQIIEKQMKNDPAHIGPTRFKYRRIQTFAASMQAWSESDRVTCPGLHCEEANQNLASLNEQTSFRRYRWIYTLDRRRVNGSKHPIVIIVANQLNATYKKQ
jgi:hypothetical protein